ncbi:MAG: toll/interleukin-1 receptor domain-containing protein [Leptolyngbyaceae cyanobacterium RU_5_1]|nr:toll/interleukin-1 receptor domain-containing protein [Leptolyngbyaceae cyanobacterium RU_5_1]
MTAPANKAAIEVFFSYAHEDEDLRDKLANHLKLLERQGVIQKWHDRQILAGTEWKGQIDRHLETAQIILLLVSSDFLASDYCYDIEMKRALERHDAGEARVIPIILRSVDNWWKTPFGKLQALPTDAKPVTNWANLDGAFADVARGIRLTAEAWQQGEHGTVPQSGANPENTADQPSTPSSQPAEQLQSSNQNQTNTENSTGWQIHVSGGTVNIGNSPAGQSSKPDKPHSTTLPNLSGNLTTMQRQRLEQRRDRLQEEWTLRSSKLKQLRSAYAIETSAAVKFQLQQQIEAEETQLAQLEAELNDIEQTLKTGTVSANAQP